MTSPRIEVLAGDCLDVIRTLADCSIDAVCTDPPYALVSIVKRFGADNAAPCKAGKTGAYQRASAGFMGKKWDTGDVAFSVGFWAEVLRVLKPGGHLVAFGGTRTYHRLACAIEDAGFEIRDQLQWIYGSGFPKSHDVSKGIDKAAGAERAVAELRKNNKADSGPKTYAAFGEFRQTAFSAITAPATVAARQWEGWGTALKPAHEPIVLARKPLSEPTVAANVLRWGTGALNIDGCRIESDGAHKRSFQPTNNERAVYGAHTGFQPTNAEGRWPANIILDGSPEVLAGFPESKGQLAAVGPANGAKASVNVYGDYGPREQFEPRGDSGSAARYFYHAKADANDRIGSRHPTIKPVALMRWPVRLITPPSGTVLDPFAGSGTTGEAAWLEGFNAILIEREAEYLADIARRMEHVRKSTRERRQTIAMARVETAGPLFEAAE